MALAEQTACSGQSLASLVTWARLALCAPRWVGLRAQGVTPGLNPSALVWPAHRCCP